MRVKCCKGDMIVLPAGMYHRFTLDDNNYIKVGTPLDAASAPLWMQPLHPPAALLCPRVHAPHIEAALVCRVGAS